jgi:hypothetical protein
MEGKLDPQEEKWPVESDMKNVEHPFDILESNDAYHVLHPSKGGGSCTGHIVVSVGRCRGIGIIDIILLYLLCTETLTE